MINEIHIINSPIRLVELLQYDNIGNRSTALTPDLY